MLVFLKRKPLFQGHMGSVGPKKPEVTLVKISKLNWGNLCAYLWFLLILFVGLNGSKLVANFT